MNVPQNDLISGSGRISNPVTLPDTSLFFLDAFEGGQGDTSLETPDETFRVHQAIIQVRAPALSKQLREGGSIHPQTLRTLLRYLYSDELFLACDDIRRWKDKLRTEDTEWKSQDFSKVLTYSSKILEVAVQFELSHLVFVILRRVYDILKPDKITVFNLEIRSFCGILEKLRQNSSMKLKSVPNLDVFQQYLESCLDFFKTTLLSEISSFCSRKLSYFRYQRPMGSLLSSTVISGGTKIITMGGFNSNNCGNRAGTVNVFIPQTHAWLNFRSNIGDVWLVGHTTTALDGDGQRVLMYGGSLRCPMIMNCESFDCVPVDVRNSIELSGESMSPLRARHSMSGFCISGVSGENRNLPRKLNLLLMFGGVKIASGALKRNWEKYFSFTKGSSPLVSVSNDLFVLEESCDLHWTWRRLSPPGSVPCPRFGHASATVQESYEVVIYGGKGEKHITLGDLYVLRLGTLPGCLASRWLKVKAGGEPPGPREGATLERIPNKRLFVLIGGSSYGSISDCHVLALNSCSVHNSMDGSWSQLSVEGPKFAWHSTSLIGDVLFLFGGTMDSAPNQVRKENNPHVYQLDLRRFDSFQTWDVVRCSSETFPVCKLHRVDTTFSDDITKLFDTASPDGNTWTVESLKTPAHRWILGAQEGMLGAMLSSGMAESRSSNIALDGPITAGAAVSIFIFLYTGRVIFAFPRQSTTPNVDTTAFALSRFPESKEQIDGLLCAAQYLCIPSLAGRCELLQQFWNSRGSRA